MTPLLVATTNADKLREIRAVLAGAAVDLRTLDEAPRVPEPDETGVTFAENARIKALYYGALTPSLTVAEDSGLEIDALGGAPGVRSARFLGPEASYLARFAEIQRRLAEVPAHARQARFVCALAVVQEGEVRFETTGTIEGLIAAEARGTGGFGYDPIFFYPPFGRTLAEVSAAEKLSVAHRGKAFSTLANWLRGRA
ncbi:MAG: RdgB/HAM1 family non-canonical purine NTP pyrophosphatase [Vicinamibacterales bacterium]